MLQEAGREVAMGGNIGVPILDLPPPSDDRVHVVECSSFQIDLAPSLAPSVGLLINVTPDHLDRHGTVEAYAAIKERLVANAGTALVGIDDEYCRTIAARLKDARADRLVAISARRRRCADVWIADHRVMTRDGARALIDLRIAPALRGAHNGQNAAFAFAAARALGLGIDAIASGFASFPGLAHRMEQVGRRGRVLFVNNSKATNADAAEKALLSFRDIFWIVGGKPKEGGIEPLRPLFPRIAKAYLIGAASEPFAATLGDAVRFERCGTLEVGHRRRRARRRSRARRAEPVVLLSPACASYDQFANFEARGDRFRALVAERLAVSAAPQSRRRPSMISRAERGPVADWLRSVDRWLLGSFAALMIVGVVMALAASPAVAERLGLPTFHFVNRQAELLLPCAILLVATSFLSPRHVRRAALILFASAWR